ncbi:hypothetical protein GGI23_003731 [Coemansia sp. RSA 2559]|nr:hypothetical protein GGI23_003731 [Coemansia sp. RSA 2559]KAJ2857559.1 hypothetical protein GGI22_003484 [Coemansia erecta]
MAGVSDSLNALGFDVSGSSRRSLLASPSAPSSRRTLGTAPALLGSGSLYTPAAASAEEKVVLDVGTYTLRAGFSGDAQPLHREELFGAFGTARGTYLQRAVGRQHGLLACLAEDEGGQDVLERGLAEHLRHLYRTQLLVDAKAKKVAIVESPMLPAPVKRALARVLLGNLRVPQLSFYPAPVAALVTCGRTTGLVVDCGHRSTTVAPVYDSRPLVPYIVATPLAGHSVHQAVRALVTQFGVVEPARGRPSLALRDFPQPGSAEEVLDDSVVRHIATKLLYASPRPPPPPSKQAGASEACHLAAESFGHELVEWFHANSTASSGDGITRITLPTKAYGPLVLAVPSWIRERAVEVLLAGDKTADHTGIVDALIACISKVPMDTRRELIASILVTGGVADIPNFSARLLHDLKLKLASMPRWAGLARDAALADRSGAGANASLFAASDRPWIGASLAVAAKIGGIDIRRDEFDESPTALLSRLD